MRAIIIFTFMLALSLIVVERAFMQASDTAAIRKAVEKSLPVLQRVGPPFIENTGCVSCHHNALPAMAITLSRERGFKVDDSIARANAAAVHSKVEAAREKLLLGIGIPGDATTVSYIMLGLAASKQPPDKSTDAMVHYLLGKQAKDGRWKPVGYRPPLEFSDFTTTAITLRALQLYAPRSRAREVEHHIDLAQSWLLTARPRNTEERVFQLLGLRWASANKNEIRNAVKELLGEQRPDGGWAQLSGLESDAYATGQALFALHQAGDLPVAEAAYQRGVKFLLKTQHEDGSWLVQSRAIPLQRYFESGFPHGKNQWISAAGTSWATMALALAVKTNH